MEAGALSVVGPGRAGTALALALVSRGWTLTSVAGRSMGRVRHAARDLGVEPVTVDAAGRGADLVVLSTPDDVLRDVAARVVGSLEHGALVVHLSGASTLAVLDPIAQARPDVVVGSLHPLQTLRAGSGPEQLEGAWCAVEGPLVDLARDLGMQPIVVPPDRRTVYHAAATTASNHLTAVLGQVERLADAAGVPFEAFAPLVARTIDNVAELGPSGALTGPVARGDVATVAAHLDALPPEERATYRALARAAATLAARDDIELAVLLEDSRAGSAP